MRVTVRLYAVAREAAGRKEEPVELPGGSRVLDLIDALCARHGEGFRNLVYDAEGAVREYLVFSVNDVDVMSLGGFRTVLRDGDTVLILPPLGGGW